MIERDDVRRAVRLYGGRARPLRERPLCFRHGAPAPPRDVVAELQAVESAAGWSVRGRLRWRNPTSPSFAGIEIAYAPSPCPAQPSDPGATLVFAEADDSFVGDRTWERRRGETSSAPVAVDGLPPGVYCVAIWSTDEAALRRSARAATVEVVVGPAPAQPRTP